jgi:hypothetical protein
MKKILYMIAMGLLFFACKPEAYVGPLDSPLGNWDGIRCEYYFNGEHVGDADTTYYSAMTFYKEGLCCIEGVKGAFPFLYDDQANTLQIDSLLWEVINLHTEDMTLKYLGRIYPALPPADEVQPAETNDNPDSGSDMEDGEVPEEGGQPEEDQGPKPDKNGIILPVVYQGFTIDADPDDYYYINSSGSKIYCTPVGRLNAEGIMDIALWYDTRTDYYGPLVAVPVKK